MKFLNPELHAALREVFGHVSVTNPGQPAAYSVRLDLDTYAAGRAPGYIHWSCWGETYSVNCPECGDTRSRLYVGHMWGVWDEQAGKNVYSCVKCHNEDCRVDLYNMLRNRTPIGSLSGEQILAQASASEQRRMEYPGEPDDLVPVNRLPAGHPTREYLVSRGFTDLDLLTEEYGFVHCLRSPWKRSIRDSSGKWHSITPENRLIIPNMQGGKWDGWMARYVGDLPKDPGTGKPLIQKYLNAPGFSSGSSVYRIGQAAAFTGGEFALVCEGALSAIACGMAGVATFGMYPKPMQEELLVRHFGKGRLVFLVESEAAANGRIHSCIDRLSPQVAQGCVTVLLAPGKDPANMSSEGLAELVQQAMKAGKA